MNITAVINCRSWR